MEFTATEVIPAPRELVLDALGTREYYEFLATKVSTIEQPELLSVETSDGHISLRVRYAFAGELSGPAKMVIDASKLTWVIETRLEKATSHAVLDIIPDHYGDLVVAEAEVDFVDRGVETAETITGSLEVKIPLLGATAERVIVDGLLRHLSAEAEALGAFCQQMK